MGNQPDITPSPATTPTSQSPQCAPAAPRTADADQENLRPPLLQVGPDEVEDPDHDDQSSRASSGDRASSIERRISRILGTSMPGRLDKCCPNLTGQQPFYTIGNEQDRGDE